ncbi:hypothetical protein SAMN06295912_108139 [Sphingomonas laterariae]|uniref:Phage regulatory protein CII (CP76) n=1 Tax=Edaphosphingomonas laterariae TaxID=861865 RepID=A0A239FB09_9SPHN|nr:hypothetical protein [Sphingomonas laterariae]SNS53698.1 hypothetical protein SAMN06295912_108139 [Sphingomonas laterariae]
MKAGGLTPEKIALKRATGEMIKGVGGLEVAAMHCRVGKTRLAQAADARNPDNAEQFVAIDVVQDLEPLARGRAGWPHVLRELATSMGFDLVERPTAEPDSDDWHEQMSELAEAGAGITRGLCAALKGDRRITPHEIKEFGLIGQVDDLIGDAVRLRAMLKMVEAGQ